MTRNLPQLRTFFGYMMAHPGKKLLFMGQEFGQFAEWSEAHGLDWNLLDFERHRQLQQYVADLNRLYLDTPALWQVDYSWKGFQWIVPDDDSQSVIVFRRIDRSGKEIIAACNFTPVTREKYQFGVPRPGSYKTLFCSDDVSYGGEGTVMRTARSRKKPMHGLDYSISVTLPAFSVVFFSVPEEKKAEKNTAKPAKKSAAKGKKSSGSK